MKIQNLRKALQCLNFRKLKKPTALFIGAIFIMSALSFLATSAIQVEASTSVLYTFGDTKVETQIDEMPTGWISAIKFTAPEDGTVSKLTYYCSGVSVGKTKCFVYNSDSHGSPNQLIASSNEVGVTTVGMWRDYAVPPFDVVAGATYWLAFMGNVKLHTPIASGEANQWSWTGSGALVYPNAPSSFVEGGFTNYKASIYVTYISTTPIPTPTSSSIPSPTPTATLIPALPITPTPVPVTTPAPTINPQYAGLRVDGNKIKDADGNIVILRGVVDSSTTWAGGLGAGNNQFVYMRNWGCNVVRITVGMWDIGYTKGNLGCFSDSSYMARLDSQVNYAIANGIYPMIGAWHAIQGDCPDGSDSTNVGSFMSKYHTWTDYQNVYKILAQRYAGRGVIYEMYNEPLFANLATYKTQMEATIDTIRTYDPTAIVVVQAVGSGNWDTMSLRFLQSNPINRANVLYSVHVYAAQCGSSQSAIRAKLGSGTYNCYADWALAHGYAVMSTEFGGGGNGKANGQSHLWSESGVTVFSTAWLNSFMTVFDADGYSGYTAWRWCTSGQDNIWNLLSDWNGNPTTYGKVVRNYYLTH
jgi:aryl-phospho-beta-D-glucosidase BglC (GH1 family)